MKEKQPKTILLTDYNHLSNLSALQTEPYVCANSVDPDELAHNEPTSGTTLFAIRYDFD